MPDLGAPDYQVARFLLERGLAAIYLVAFTVAYRQFPALCGDRGLEPAPRFLKLIPRFLDARRCSDGPATRMGSSAR